MSERSTGLRLDWGVASDPGQVRPQNEDSAMAEDGLFAVADGMGGHAAGEVASRLAVEALQSNVATAGLLEGVHLANRAVIERAEQDASTRGMGTTICALALLDDGGTPRVEIVNVGDSRAYLFRDGELEQVTEDHNLVAQLEREGRLTAEEARVHPQRNIITRVLGNDPDVEVDVFNVDPFRGDRFLLCSDGLFNEVVHEDMVEVLRTEPDPQAAVDELVRRANAGGGRDNITVVLVDVLEDGDRARTASAALAGAASTAAARPVPAPGPATESVRPVRDDDAITIEPRTHRRVTWRSLLFVFALFAVIGLIGGSVWWFGRNSFYVGVRDDEVTIFRGRPGGVLWLDPTVEETTGLQLADVPPARRRDVESGREQATLADARRYVDNLEALAEEQRPTTTTTTAAPVTTSTSLAPAPAPPP